MGRVVCIVDYWNFYPNRQSNHRALLAHDLSRIVEIAVKIAPAADRVDVRLYGGWLQGGVLAREASEVQQDLGNIAPFPIRHPCRKGLLHGEARLVLSIEAIPNLQWEDTLKETRGLPRLRVETASLGTVCQGNKAICPILCLRRLAKKKGKVCGVTGCTETNSSAFVRRQQKMVDTMMVCDALHLAQEEEVAGLVVLTDDVDLLPGLAMARRLSEHTITIGFRNKRLVQMWSSLVQSLSLECFDWGESDGTV